MLLGAAILGAVASRKYSTLQEAMKSLNAAGQVCINCFLMIIQLSLVVFFELTIVGSTGR